MPPVSDCFAFYRGSVRTPPDNKWLLASSTGLPHSCPTHIPLIYSWSRKRPCLWAVPSIFWLYIQKGAKHPWGDGKWQVCLPPTSYSILSLSRPSRVCACKIPLWTLNTKWPRAISQTGMGLSGVVEYQLVYWPWAHRYAKLIHCSAPKTSYLCG